MGRYNQDNATTPAGIEKAGVIELQVHAIDSIRDRVNQLRSGAQKIGDRIFGGRPQAVAEKDDPNAPAGMVGRVEQAHAALRRAIEEVAEEIERLERL